MSTCGATPRYKRALRTHPRAPPSVRLGIGACHLKLGNFPAARAAFTRALDLDPDSTEALLGLALVELNAESAVPPGLRHGATGDDDDDDDAAAAAAAAAHAAYDEAVARGLVAPHRYRSPRYRPPTRILNPSPYK